MGIVGRCGAHLSRCSLFVIDYLTSVDVYAYVCVVHQTHLGVSSESNCAPGSCWALSLRCSSAASEEWGLLAEAAAGFSFLKIPSSTLEDNY